MVKLEKNLAISKVVDKLGGRWVHSAAASRQARAAARIFFEKSADHAERSQRVCV
jgi:hypothetical protein